MSGREGDKKRFVLRRFKMLYFKYKLNRFELIHCSLIVKDFEIALNYKINSFHLKETKYVHGIYTVTETTKCLGGKDGETRIFT